MVLSYGVYNLIKEIQEALHFRSSFESGIEYGFPKDRSAHDVGERWFQQ